MSKRDNTHIITIDLLLDKNKELLGRWDGLRKWLISYLKLLLDNPDSYEQTMIELIKEIIDKMYELECD